MQIETLILKFIWNRKGHRTAQTILNLKLTRPGFKLTANRQRWSRRGAGWEQARGQRAAGRARGAAACAAGLPEGRDGEDRSSQQAVLGQLLIQTQKNEI